MVVRIPAKTRYPKPPAPINAAMVMRPTAVTAEIRTPAIITGSAIGIFTLVRTCFGVSPIPLAASTIRGSIPEIPV